MCDFTLWPLLNFENKIHKMKGYIAQENHNLKCLYKCMFALHTLPLIPRYIYTDHIILKGFSISNYPMIMLSSFIIRNTTKLISKCL